jgi:DNA-binding SARP family transcriptional activator
MAGRTVPAASADEAVHDTRERNYGSPVKGGGGRQPHERLKGVVSLSLLGGFELTRASQELKPPTSAKRVIAFLALQERPVHRLYVAGKLWPHVSEARSNASLRTALWRLHRCDGAIVDASAEQLGLAAQVRVDLREVASRAREILYATDAPPRGVVNTLCRAGDLLPDFYDDWVLVERESFRQLRLHALERLCGQLARCGRLGEALEAGLAAVAADPLRETAHCALVSVYLAEGNRSEALRQYERFRDLLRDKLALEPSPQIRALLSS